MLLYLIILLIINNVIIISTVGLPGGVVMVTQTVTCLCLGGKGPSESLNSDLELSVGLLSIQNHNQRKCQFNMSLNRLLLCCMPGRGVGPRSRSLWQKPTWAVLSQKQAAGSECLRSCQASPYD